VLRGGLSPFVLAMKLRISITIQFSHLPETTVFESDLVWPETVSSTLAIAEQTARATLAATYAGPVCIREYLGPTLIATIHSNGPSREMRPSAPLELESSTLKGICTPEAGTVYPIFSSSCEHN
jgi:hypothetical protein